MRPRIKRILQLYISSVVLYFLGTLFLHHGFFYPTFLTPLTQKIILYLFSGYIIIAPFYYIFFAKEHSTNKPFLVFRGMKRMLTQFRLNKEEKVAFLFILVKLFFLPTMTQFSISNFHHFMYLLKNFQWYPFALTTIFLLDTSIFALGYTFEFPALKNVVRSVEPTLFGWAVAVVCYPPFNTMLGKYVPWGANDYVLFLNPAITTIMQIVLVFLLFIYVAATFALGPKASNLTNRGIVTRFPYSIIRHPAYISKNLIWWLTLLPVISWQFALGMVLWSIIYYFRSTTEERHLLQDPEYVTYCKKVKWKFIPFVW